MQTTIGFRAQGLGLKSGNEGMEKNRDVTMMCYIETTTPSFLANQRPAKGLELHTHTHKGIRDYNPYLIPTF